MLRHMALSVPVCSRVLGTEVAIKRGAELAPGFSYDSMPASGLPQS